MSENSSPLLNWLIKQFDGQELAPPGRSLRELSDAAERLVRVYLGKSKPLRPSRVAKKLVTLSNNLRRAANVALELGEQGMSHVVLASNCNNPDAADPTAIIAHLQQWELWSTRAAETAKLMSLSAEDNTGGRTPDFRLRGLVNILLDRYEFLLGVEATHTMDTDTGLGHSVFDLFVKEAIRLHAPEGVNLEPHVIDDAISRALDGRKQFFR
jgi:hypothetical protein